jgi:hypothetical protein
VRTRVTFHPSDLLLLLPPSEGKAEGGRRTARSDGSTGWTPRAGRFGRRAAVAELRERIVAALAGVGGGDGTLLGLKEGDLLDRARAANTSLVGSPTLPAWQRYTGVVWDHLDPATLDAAARRRIVVVSGLLGVAAGDDPVPDYRLKMNVALPGVGKLSAVWSDEVSAAIARAGRSRVIVDLLPNEHRAAWAPPPGADHLRVELVDPSGRPGGHFAKAAKGRLARALLIDGSDALATWTDERFDLAVLTPG